MDKRKIYLRIMREAKERTEYERNKENKKRTKLGQSELPVDTLKTSTNKPFKLCFKNQRIEKYTWLNWKPVKLNKKLMSLKIKKFQINIEFTPKKNGNHLENKE